MNILSLGFTHFTFHDTRMYNSGNYSDPNEPSEESIILENRHSVHKTRRDLVESDECLCTFKIDQASLNGNKQVVMVAHFSPLNYQ